MSLFSAIPWHTYLTVLFTLTLVYYGVLVYLYYGEDLAGYFNSRSAGGRKVATAPSREIVRSFSRDLRGIVDDASNQSLDKKVLMSSISLLINKYPEIKDPTLQDSVMEFMIRECVSSIHLSEEELRELWN